MSVPTEARQNVSAPDQPEIARVKLISVMPLPEWATLPSEVRQAYLSLQIALGRLSAADDPSVATWATRLSGLSLDRLPRMHGLEHRLSPEMFARSPLDRLEPRTPGEIAVAQKSADLLHESFQNGGRGFIEALITAHELGTGLNSGLRTGGMRSLPDKLGSYVVFPEVETIAPGLERLCEFIKEHLEVCPAFAASVAMTSICNLHPFVDGNGRLSRLVFNGLATQRSRRATYLPLHELGRISRGGFLIAMRLAQYRSNWLSLGGFLTAAAGATSLMIGKIGPAPTLSVDSRFDLVE